jgi:hypothetical protein
MRKKKKLKSLIILVAVLLVLVGVGTAVKNILLNQIRHKIEENFGYSNLRLSIFPPTLILEDARSKSVSPFFSARKISIKISFSSLLSKERPIILLIDNPVLRIYGTPKKEEKEQRKKFSLALPFAIEKGLIRDGDLYYWGDEARMQLQGINAVFTQRGEEFSIMGKAQENYLLLSSDRRPIEGKVSFLLDGRGSEVNIKRFKMSGPRGVLKVVGHIVDPFDPEIQVETNYNLRVNLLFDILDIPFESQGWVVGKATVARNRGKILIDTGFSSDDLVLNKIRMGKVDGNVNFRGSAGHVDLNIQKGGSRQEFVRINFNKDRIWGIARGLHLDPIMSFAGVPWPIISPSWGSFTLDKDKLHAELEFRDEILESKDSKYPIRGLVKVDWDRKKKFSFFSEHLDSSFFGAKLDGGLVVGQTVDFTIDGEITDVKQARDFTSLVLQKNFEFPEIRGRGESLIRIFGDFMVPEVRAKFNVSPGGFKNFDVESVEGEAEIIGNEFYGFFNVNDPSITGKIGVYAHNEDLKVDSDLEAARVETLLPGFDISTPFTGEASGKFEFNQKGEDLQLKGTFFSPQLEFSGQILSNVKGRLEWNGDSFSFPDLTFDLYGGKIQGSVTFGLLNREFDTKVTGEGINLSSVYAPLKGVLSFQTKGNGTLGVDPASGQFEIKDLNLYPFQRTETQGEMQITFTEQRIDLEVEGNFEPGENKFFISLGIPIEEDAIFGDIRGSFSNYDLLLPWTGARGQINYIATINGTKTAPQVKGGIDFQGTVFPFPQFAHALRDYTGLVLFENGTFSLRSIQGTLGGGEIQGSGRMRLGRGGVEEIDVKVEGTNLLLSPLERTRALTDANLSLIKDAHQFVLDGEFLVHRLSWRREITEKFAFSTASSLEMNRKPNFFDDLTLNLRIKADDNAWMENSLGKIRGRFDLSISGNIHSPIVLGDMEALDGELYFQDRVFRILRGRVSFVNPQTIEPYLSFKGETYVKDYRVTFSLDGLLDRLNPDFSSSPPLPPEDVLALLALGEAFKRTYSYDISTQLSTASLLSFQLSEEAKKRAEGLFFIDRFRIDPFVIGSSAEVTARVTVGKNISRNLAFLYSTNLTTLREEIIRIEWKFTRDFSIVGTRDEEGRATFDVKIHKRF